MLKIYYNGINSKIYALKGRVARKLNFPPFFRLTTIYNPDPVFKIKNFWSILFNIIFSSDVLCLKIRPKNEHFSNVNFRPLPSLVKSTIIKKTQTNVHNYDDSSILIHLIWFFSLSTFEVFAWKPKPEKALQRAITRDRKLISK